MLEVRINTAEAQDGADPMEEMRKVGMPVYRGKDRAYMVTHGRLDVCRDPATGETRIIWWTDVEVAEREGNYRPRAGGE